MPTINQLIRKGRATIEQKSTAPALQWGYNSLKRKQYPSGGSPQKRGVCTRFILLLLKNLTQHSGRLLVCV